VRAKAAAAKPSLLLIDFLNPLDFDGAERLAPHALKAARQTAVVAARMRRKRYPVIYVNDNFGHWESEFSSVVASCRERGGASAHLSELVAPQPGDISVLKPRHSGFYGTPLEFLLEELRIDTLVVTGIAADSCVMFTAMDAFMRQFRLWVPRNCVASKTTPLRDRALQQMERAAKAVTMATSVGLAKGIAAARDRHRQH
jgi:nicotinamidase-related amidase